MRREPPDRRGRGGRRDADAQGHHQSKGVHQGCPEAAAKPGYRKMRRSCSGPTTSPALSWSLCSECWSSTPGSSGPGRRSTSTRARTGCGSTSAGRTVVSSSSATAPVPDPEDRRNNDRTSGQREPREPHRRVLRFTWADVVHNLRIRAGADPGVPWRMAERSLIRHKLGVSCLIGHELSVCTIMS